MSHLTRRLTEDTINTCPNSTRCSNGLGEVRRETPKGLQETHQQQSSAPAVLTDLYEARH